MKDHVDRPQDRKSWMSLLAQAPEGAVAAALDGAMTRPAHDWLRAPEVGTVMVQGRASGTGAPFNLGEMTVTRCAVQLPCGTVGHAYVQGRRKGCAEAAALVDALMQTEAAETISAEVLAPLQQIRTDLRAKRSAKAAATKVEFFTMLRGDD